MPDGEEIPLYDNCSTFCEALAELARMYYANEQVENEEERAAGRERLAEAVGLLREDIAGARRLKASLCNECSKSSAVSPETVREAAQALKDAGTTPVGGHNHSQLLEEMLERLPERAELEARINELEKAIEEERTSAAIREHALKERTEAFSTFVKEVNTLETALGEDDDSEDDDTTMD